MALNRSDKSRILRRYFPGMTRNSEMSTEPNDHDVYRCRGCGYLFSPGDSSGATSPAPSRTVAVQPGYRTRE